MYNYKEDILNISTDLMKTIYNESYNESLQFQRLVKRLVIIIPTTL